MTEQTALPPVVDQDTWRAALDELRKREKAATRELDAIAAVVIGGTSLMGGRGGMMLTLVGTLIIGYVNKILSLLGWQEAQRLLAKGLIIVLAVVIQETRRRR